MFINELSYLSCYLYNITIALCQCFKKYLLLSCLNIKKSSIIKMQKHAIISIGSADLRGLRLY